MKTKIIQFVPALVALLVIGFRYFSNWCIDDISVCYGTWIHWVSLSITKPLYLFSLFFLPVAIVLAFLPRETFRPWLKFAMWAIPISVIYIWTTPLNSSSWMEFFPFYRDDAARFAGVLFSIGSLIITIPKFVLSSVYKRKNPYSSPEDLHPYLASWYMVLNAIGGLVCISAVFVMSIIPFSYFPRGGFETFMALFAGVVIFSAFSLWALLREARSSTNTADRVLCRICKISSVGLVVFILAFIVSMRADNFTLYGAGIFAVINLFALLALAISGSVRKLHGIPSVSGKIVATSFILSATISALLAGVVAALFI
jgi:hypothetical protein